MQTLFWVACGKWGGGKCDKVGVWQQRKWLGGLCAHPVEQRMRRDMGGLAAEFMGSYKLVDISHIEDVCGGHGAPKKTS